MKLKTLPTHQCLTSSKLKVEFSSAGLKFEPPKLEPKKSIDPIVAAQEAEITDYVLPEETLSEYFMRQVLILKAALEAVNREL